MPLPLESRHPDLHTSATNSYEQSRRAYTNGIAENLGFTATDAISNPLDILTQETEAKRQTGELAGQNVEARKALETCLESTTELFSRINVPVPDIKTLIKESGNTRGEKINLKYLDQEYQRMEAEGLEPRWVLAPSGLPLKAILNLYEAITPVRDDKGNILDHKNTSPNNPLEQFHYSTGLVIRSPIRENWDNWTTDQGDPTKTLGLSHQLPTRPDGTSVPYYTDSRGYQWTLCLIQGTQRNSPYHYNGAAISLDPLDSPIRAAPQKYQPSHPTITQLLTLHARNVQEGASHFEMLDIEAQSWTEAGGGLRLHGEYRTYIPTVSYNTTDPHQHHNAKQGVVRIDIIDPDLDNGFAIGFGLGSRSVVG